MPDQQEKRATVFDGFAYRPFNPKLDGWMDEQPDMADYPAVAAAAEVVGLFHQLCEEKRKNWRLRQELKLYQKSNDSFRDHNVSGHASGALP